MALQEIKKRHVERVTRLPTKRMATACWAFIVAKSTRRETAPLLDFSSLQRANSENYQQVVHKCLWTTWGQFQYVPFVAATGRKRPVDGSILPSARFNPTFGRDVSRH
jgi:hypothetical protein